MHELPLSTANNNKKEAVRHCIFFNKACGVFQECRTFFVNSFISCGMASPHIIDPSDFAFRKVPCNQTNCWNRQTIRYELMIAGTSSRTADFCRSEMPDPFFRAYSTVSKIQPCPFQNKMAAKNAIFRYLFACMHCSDASTQIPWNLKTDRNEVKMFCEKECNILIKSHWLSDTGNIFLETYKSDKQTRAAHSFAHSFVYRICNSLGEIFPVSESQCGLIYIYFIGKHIRKKLTIYMNITIWKSCETSSICIKGAFWKFFKGVCLSFFPQ